MIKKLKAVHQDLNPAESIGGPLYHFDQEGKVDYQDSNPAKSLGGSLYHFDQERKVDYQDLNPGESSEGPQHHLDQVGGDQQNLNPAESPEGSPRHVDRGDVFVCTWTVDFAALTRGIELSENAPVVHWPGGFTTCIPFIAQANNPSRNVLVLVTIHHLPLFPV